MPDPAPPVTRLERILECAARLARVPVRLWRFDGRALRPAGGEDPGWMPPVPRSASLVPTPDGSVWLEPIPDIEGFWLEVPGGDEAEMARAAQAIAPLLGALLASEREHALIAEELATRYEEIDLLYAINDILGRTIGLEDAAQAIVVEVSNVFNARRASIMVHDPQRDELRTVASRGFDPGGLAPIAVSDESVAARAYREARVVGPEDERREGASRDAASRDAASGDAASGDHDDASRRGYLGEAFLSVPICYAAPGGTARCVGVINLTDRLGSDTFSPADRKLISAIATQIGAAIENARLAARDLAQQRIRRELELAHDLQLRLLPSPSVLHGDAEVAARCVPAESVGGDFYSFSRLGRGRVGVMLGDVASHGFSAALMMAAVLSAAGIHAAAAVTPDETLAALLDSLQLDLTSNEMFLTVFYGVLDPLGGRLSYANAGHPHAFRVPRFGEPERLGATSPPLGLVPAARIERRQVPWSVGSDLLCLCTDGLVDARNADGQPFGEHRLLATVAALRAEPVDAILNAVIAELDAYAPKPIDDRSLLVLRI